MTDMRYFDLQYSILPYKILKEILLKNRNFAQRYRFWTKVTMIKICFLNKHQNYFFNLL